MTSPAPVAPVPTPTLWKKGEALYSLTNNKFASVTRCHDQTLVHIRQYTETDTGDLKSTRRGFTLLPEEFNQLLSISSAILRDVFAVTPVSDQQWQQEEQQQETPQQPDTRQMVPPTPTPSPLMQRRETTTMTKPPKKTTSSPHSSDRNDNGSTCCYRRSGDLPPGHSTSAVRTAY
ncbi:hypothetical protein BaRGS_00028765 [Batillaria attramentaria]|uniref:Transcriptional coactivator p15 (PC4) C-terminal domain-containing protein n=1 Tax=Batillaria attramentaria TaxID=370345 RepID=A0ABD0JZ87_9CAEN